MKKYFNYLKIELIALNRGSNYLLLFFYIQFFATISLGMTTFGEHKITLAMLDKDPSYQIEFIQDFYSIVSVISNIFIVLLITLNIGREFKYKIISRYLFEGYTRAQYFYAKAGSVFIINLIFYLLSTCLIIFWTKFSYIDLAYHAANTTINPLTMLLEPVVIDSIKETSVANDSMFDIAKIIFTQQIFYFTFLKITLLSAVTLFIIFIVRRSLISIIVIFLYFTIFYFLSFIIKKVLGISIVEYLPLFTFTSNWMLISLYIILFYLASFLYVKKVDSLD